MQMTRTFHQSGAGGTTAGSGITTQEARDITSEHSYPGTPVRYVQEFPFIFNPNALPPSTQISGSPLGP